MWVSAGQFTGEHGGREVDPAPLARLLCATLRIVGDPAVEMQALAEDRDGPIHIVRLLAACEYTVQQATGRMPRELGGIEPPFSLVVNAYRDGGRPAATAAVQAMAVADRVSLISAILHLWSSPIDYLYLDLRDQHVG